MGFSSLPGLAFVVVVRKQPKGGPGEKADNCHVTFLMRGKSCGINQRQASSSSSSRKLGLCLCGSGLLSG